MKNKIRFFTAMRGIAIIAIALVIGFLTIACPADNGDPADGSGNGVPATPRPFNDITATELVANIKVGWNLGNALDATDFGEGWLPKDATVAEMEEAWGVPVTTKAMITAIKR